MFFTNFRFNYASFAAKNHVITGIEILILKKKYPMPEYWVQKVSASIFSTCIAHTYISGNALVPVLQLLLTPLNFSLMTSIPVSQCS